MLVLGLVASAPLACGAPKPRVAAASVADGGTTAVATAATGLPAEPSALERLPESARAVIAQALELLKAERDPVELKMAARLHHVKLSPVGAIIRGRGVALFVGPTGALEQYVAGDELFAQDDGDEGVTLRRRDANGPLVAWVSRTETRTLTRLEEKERVATSVRAPEGAEGSFAFLLQSSDGATRIVAGRARGPVVQWPTSGLRALRLSSDGAWLLVEGATLEAFALPTTPLPTPPAAIQIPRACGRDAVFFEREPLTGRLALATKPSTYCELSPSGQLARRYVLAPPPVHPTRRLGLVMDGQGPPPSPAIQHFVLEGRAYVAIDDRGHTSVHDRETGRAIFEEGARLVERGGAVEALVTRGGKTERVSLALEGGAVVKRVAPAADFDATEPATPTFALCVVADVPIPARFCPPPR